MTTIVDLYKNVFGGEEPEDEILETWAKFKMLDELPELRGREGHQAANDDRARYITSFAYRWNNTYFGTNTSGRKDFFQEIADGLMVEDRVKWWAVNGSNGFSIFPFEGNIKRTLRKTFKRRHPDLNIDLHLHFKDAFTGKDRVFAEDLFHLEFGPFPLEAWG
ncbi:hypothetical protein [uncultured Sphingomonas sp.]|uniref:hypothetical protein n=1 Tax=uncultured Sphingomonas sp. TaxID=158754 RepID=UPI0025F0641E|nr:hypothetical protein [uncultured Sphingomonas sp.]